MQQVSVLLVGCGDIGMYLGELLQSRGFQVTGVRRTPPDDAPFPMVSADLFRPETLNVLAGEYDFVVYTATPSQFSEAGYQAIYVDALNHLMDAISPPKQRLLLVSSTGVYHQSQGEWVDEDSATEPARFSGRKLLQGETLALHRWPNTTVVRFAGIYGPGRLRLIKKIQEGCTVVDEVPKYTNRIHRDDCAGILAYLMEQQMAGVSIGSVYVGVDDEPVTEAKVLDDIAGLLSLPKPKREPLQPDTKVNQNKRCSNAAIKQLGYVFKYPSYLDGYRQIIQDAGLVTP